MAQGGITAANGGSFWNGFASGSVSSAAVSLWKGASPNNNTLSGGGRCFEGPGKYFSSDVNMVLMGAISGGVAAVVTKGNFWQGALTGGIVAGLNHMMHQGNILDEDQTSENNGTIHTFGNKNNEYDNCIFDFASTENPEHNTVKLVAHASESTLNSMTAQEMHAYLMKKDKLYKDSITSGKVIKIKIFACSTGVNAKTGFAYNLSKLNKNAIITAPSKYTLLGKHTLGIENGGQWNEFKNGIVKCSDFYYKFGWGNQRIEKGKLYLLYKDYKKNQ